MIRVRTEKRREAAMANKKIEDVEGIGPVIGAKFRDAGIKNTNGLLAAAKTPSDRRKVAKSTGLTTKQVLKFANMVDLYRINGIGSEFAELLEAANVNTVVQLSKRNAATLTAKLEDVNKTKKLTRRVPDEKTVKKWIDKAQALPRALEY